MGSCDNHPEVSPQLIYRLLQDLGSAVMAVDSERRILFINKQARNLLGIGDRDLSQVPISELASSGEISTLRSIVGALDTALIDRRTFQRELLTVETTDRGIRTIACNVTPLFADAGDLEAATAIFSDITEVHAGERRRVGLECEAHIARVVSWVAHETTRAIWASHSSPTLRRSPAWTSVMSEKIAVAASRSPESANNGVTLHAMVLIPLSVVSTVSNSRWNVLLSMRAVSRAPTIERRVDISPLEASSLMGTCERSRSPIPKRFRACLLMNRIRRSESTAITADPRSWRSRYIS